MPGPLLRVGLCLLSTVKLLFQRDISLSLLEAPSDNPLQYSCLENPMDGGAW